MVFFASYETKEKTKKAVGLKEGANITRALGVEWEIKEDILNRNGGFCGRVILTTKSPRYICETSVGGFVISRRRYDF